MTEKDDQINYTREAFLHPVNLGLLFVCTLTAFFLNDFGMVSNLILTTAFGLELVYLGTVPGSSRFRQNVKLKKKKERTAEEKNKIIFQQLDGKSQKKFLKLRYLTKIIKENFDKLPYTSQGLLENIENKISGLLSNYLTLLELHRRYQFYIHSEMEEGLKREVEIEKKKIESVDSEKLKKTRIRRLSILNKRLKKFDIAKEKFLICETHLETIEDAIHYIYEQSMTMGKGDDVGYQLDNLLSEMEETTSIIDDLEGDLLEGIEVYADDLSDLDAVPEKTDDSSGKTSQKIKN
ncbi:MAG: hypothetical protein ACFCU6_14155 [Balneolaceae bacterium]